MGARNDQTPLSLHVFYMLNPASPLASRPYLPFAAVHLENIIEDASKQVTPMAVPTNMFYMNNYFNNIN